MFDLDGLIASCREAVADPDPKKSVREALLKAVERPADVAAVLGKEHAGIDVVHNDTDLTVLNVIWAPGMSIPPHDHRMWAAIAIYGGTEENTLYRRHPERIRAAGGRSITESDVLALGADAIHAVRNPERRFTGAIHVYGGDFVGTPRSQWDPDTLMEQPYDLAYIRGLFEQANAEWRAQVGTDVDESVS